ADAMFQKLHLPAYSAEQFHADLQRVTRGRIDKQLADVLVQRSNAAIHWMHDLGIKWEIDSHVVIDGRYYFEPGLVIHPVGGVTGGFGPRSRIRGITRWMGVKNSLEFPRPPLIGDNPRIETVAGFGPKQNYEKRRRSSIFL